MIKDDEYELLPHKEIIKLREELEKLKKNPLGKGKSAENILEAINTLNESINSLIYVFQHATDQLKETSIKNEKHEEADFHPLIGKINQLIEQNKDLAEGIVTVAEMVKKEKKEIRDFEERIKPYPRRYDHPKKPDTPYYQTPLSQRPQPQPMNNNFNQDFNLTPPPGNPNPMPNFMSTSPNFNNKSNQPNFDNNKMPPPPNLNDDKSEKKKGFLSFGK